MKVTKRLGICVLLVMLVMSMTGCGKLIMYHMREDPGEAMERYLEEKYDDEFTLISCAQDEGFDFYWNKTGFTGKFESEKYPGKVIEVDARAEGLDYSFWDNYQNRTYVDIFREIMEETAEKYFTGEYYIYAYSYGTGRTEADPVLSFEEFAAADYYFGVCIYAEEMEDEAALQAMEGFREDVISQGILCSFSLGRINQEVISKDVFLQHMREKGEDFNPWGSDGRNPISNWIYREMKGEVKEIKTAEEETDSGE